MTTPEEIVARVKEHIVHVRGRAEIMRRFADQQPTHGAYDNDTDGEELLAADLTSLLGALEQAKKEARDLEGSYEALARNADQDAAALSESREREKVLEAVVDLFIAAEDEASGFGLADYIDNTGERYQSAGFAALVIKARTALTPKPLGGEA